MSRSMLVCTLAGALLASATLPAPTRSSDARAVEHGRYLVHSVAMCVQCHTPRDHEGRLIDDRDLMGEAVLISNPFPGEGDWARWAPRISGMPGYTLKDGVRLLTEGVARTGLPLRLPMPPFRMSDEDARAVVAYLMSLK